MHTHADAHLTQRGWLRLVSQHLQENRSLPELAAEAVISLRYAYKWLACYRSGVAAEVYGFDWTVLVPDIVNSVREEQGSVSV
jgi:hypothetical protein